MSVLYVCDGCGKTEPGTWVGAREEVWDEERCLVPKDEGGCGEKFKRLRFTDSEWKRPLVESGKSGGGDYWWTREDEDGQQHACSRECIAKAAEALSVSSWVAPW